MCLRAIPALILLTASLLAVRGQQIQSVHVTTQVTLQPYEVDSLLIEMPYGYSLTPLLSYTQEGQALADRIWRGRIRLYADSACSQRLKKRHVRKQFPFLKSYTPKTFQRLNPTTRYQLGAEWHLQQTEVWTLNGSSLLRATTSRMLLLERFVPNPIEGQPSSYLAFRAYLAPKGDIPLPASCVLQDLPSIDNYAPTQLAEEGLLSVQVRAWETEPDTATLASLVGAFRADANAHRAEQVALRDARRENVWFTLPLQVLPSNHWDRLPAVPAQKMQVNQQVFVQAVPKLLRDQLSGKINSYVSSLEPDTRMSPAEVQAVVARHPNTVIQPTAENLNRMDFSYGVQEVAVGGTLIRNRNQDVFFHPKYLSLIWWDEQLGGLRQLGMLKLEEFNLADYAVNRQPLDQFLTQQQYYAYLTQVGGMYAENLGQSALIFQKLMAGKWEALPLKRQLARMTDGDILNALDQ